MQKMIFIVDDNDANLTLAASALEDHYRVLTMPSAAKMFFLLGKNKIPDLIFLDIEMPEMDGMAALRRLKEHPDWSAIPVLFLTGHSEAEVWTEALAAGAAGVIGKPIVAPVLAERAAQFIG